MSLYDDVALLQTQMTAVQSALAILQTTDIAENTDLNSLTSSGHYCIPNSTISSTLLNKPTTNTATGEIIVTEGGDAGQITMKYIPCNKANPSYYQRCYYQNAWGDWHEISLIDSGWIDLPLADGITAYSDAQKPRYRKIGNEVFLSGVFRGVTASNVTIATLPSGYAPSKKVLVACPSVGQCFSKIAIETNGEIIHNRASIEPLTAENWHSIACSFMI